MCVYSMLHATCSIKDTDDNMGLADKFLLVKQVAQQVQVCIYSKYMIVYNTTSHGMNLSLPQNTSGIMSDSLEKLRKCVYPTH